MSGNQSTTLIISGVVLAIGVTFLLVFLPMLTRPEANLWLGDGIFKINVALTGASREKGLSGKTELDADHALLMVFPNESKWGVWMKKMNFPIDVVWLDKGKKVVSIVKNFSPDDTITRYPISSALYVVELPAGTADAKVISTGKVAIFQIDGKATD